MVSIVAIASFAFLWHFVKAVYESRSKGGGDWVNETNFCTLNITQSRRRCIYFLSWIRFLEYATREKGTPKTRHNIVLIPRAIRFQSVVKLHQKRGRKKLYVVIILLPCTTLRYIKKCQIHSAKVSAMTLKQVQQDYPNNIYMIMSFQSVLVSWGSG